MCFFTFFVRSFIFQTVSNHLGKLFIKVLTLTYSNSGIMKCIIYKKNLV